MEKNYYCIIIVFLMMGILSCSQDEDDMFNETEGYDVVFNEQKSGDYQTFSFVEPLSPQIETEDSIGDITFYYKGETYKSKALFGDEECVILDKFVADVFEKLKNKENVAIYVNPDNSFEFYDTYDKMCKAVKWERKSKTAMYASASSTKYKYIKEFDFRVWRDGKGRKKGGPFYHWGSLNNGDITPPPLYVPQQFLINIGLNNEISSCQMWVILADGTSGVNLKHLAPGQYQHADFTFYEFDNCGGRSLTFPEISIYKTYSQRDHFGSFGFNDLTSSIKVTFDNNI